jgi:hypothetical protein
MTSKTSIDFSFEDRQIVILGTEYAGEMKKSIFYAMNFDMPEVGVFPMHCSCNVDRKTGENPALLRAARCEWYRSVRRQCLKAEPPLHQSHFDRASMPSP